MDRSWLQPSWMSRYCLDYMMETAPQHWDRRKTDDGAGDMHIAFSIRDDYEFIGHDEFAQCFLHPAMFALISGSRREGHYTRSTLKLTLRYDIRICAHVLHMVLPDVHTAFTLRDLTRNPRCTSYRDTSQAGQGGITYETDVWPESIRFQPDRPW
jgi:hypothetical protein